MEENKWNKGAMWGTPKTKKLSPRFGPKYDFYKKRLHIFSEIFFLRFRVKVSFRINKNHSKIIRTFQKKNCNFFATKEQFSLDRIILYFFSKGQNGVTKSKNNTIGIYILNS